MSIRREHWLQGVKMALGAAAAILLSQALGLQSSPTAGIITVLSILGTKRETLLTARNRLLAYMTSLLIAFGCYSLMGYTVLAFTVYLFLFAALCCGLGWTYAIAMVSVLTSHYMIAGSMSPGLVLNETLLMAIGTGFGILVNLHLRADHSGIRQRLNRVDEGMRRQLSLLADTLEAEDASALSLAREELGRLREAIDQAEVLARRNMDNQLLHPSLYDIRYAAMRRRQCRMLAQALTAVEKMEDTPEQQRQVGAFLRQIAGEYDRNNDVSGLLAVHAGILRDMKRSPLPATRAEFESRALLYAVLLRLEDFLQAKRQFYLENQGETDKRSYNGPVY